MKVKLDIVKQMGIACIYWKYSNLETNPLMNHFDAIVNYLVGKETVIVNLLRYGIQGDKNLPEIIELESTRVIQNIDKLENYFYLDNELEKKIYDKLKKDLDFKEFEINDYSQDAYDYKKYCSEHNINEY